MHSNFANVQIKGRLKYTAQSLKGMANKRGDPNLGQKRGFETRVKIKTRGNNGCPILLKGEGKCLME